MHDDITGNNWTEEDFENSLERALNLWREVWPEASIKFQRDKSFQPVPPAGPPCPPPAKAIGPIATAPIGSIASISSSAASSGGYKPPAPKAMPKRPCPKPQMAAKEEFVPKEEVKTEEATVKTEVSAPPGLDVDELQAMTPAQKKARIRL